MVPKISLNMLEKLGALSKGGIQHRKFAQQHRQNPSGLLGKNPTPKQIDDELLQELVEQQYVHDRLAGGMFSRQDPGMLELGLSPLDETDIFLKKLVQEIMRSGGAIRLPKLGLGNKVRQINPATGYPHDMRGIDISKGRGLDIMNEIAGQRGVDWW